MSKMLMKLPIMFAAMMMIVSLNACARPEPRKIAISDSCINFKKISFAELPNGVLDDVGNKADTPQTVDEVLEHNARFGAICPVPGPAN